MKRAIDEGLLPGPRIYPSGAVITITGGHGDFRLLSESPRRPGTLSRVEQMGAAIIADSPDEVRMRDAKNNSCKAHLRSNSLLGGGVASPFSPLTLSYLYRGPSFDAVEAVKNWGTYVSTHAYTPALYPAFDRRGGKVHRARTPNG